MGLKEKAINGVFWNASERFFSYGIEFFVGIILARLLTPKEFGLIGTIMVFIVISEAFINGGFSHALIRKQNCTQKDYTTVFIFNIVVGVLLFLLLLITASPISNFFNNSELKPLIQVLGIGLIISSLTLIQKVKLTKRIDFKLQTKISLIASIVSGFISIIMAYKGYGVWCLIAKSLINQSVNSILLWYWNKWKPDMHFSLESFRELFGFGSKLLISRLLGTLMQNINYIIIAKFFTPQDLGYFTRAELFKNFVAQNATYIVTTVGYPVLVTIQDERVRLKAVFRKMLTNTFFIVAILMAGIVSTAKTMVLALIGEQWLPSVILLQMLCFAGVLMPLNSMNVNILNVVGRSGLYLKLQLIVELMAIPNIFFGIFFGIKPLILGIIFIELISYVIFNHESNKVLHYPIREQLVDIIPSFVLALSMAIVVFAAGYIMPFGPVLTLTLQILIGISVVLTAGELLKIDEYVFLKNSLIEKINSTNLFKRIS